jgi:hypothetical protein
MKAVRSAVFSLFASSRPTTVGWFVIAVVIEAIKGHGRRWADAHVSKKIGEIFPAFTDFNATSAVVFISAIRWYAASTAHSLPDFIFGRVGLAVRSPSLPREFGFETSARTRTAVSQRAAGKEPFDSAFTKTEPAFSRIFAIGNDGQSTKSLAGKIDGVSHGK